MDKTLISNLETLVNTRPESKKGLIEASLATLKWFDGLYAIDYFETENRENDFDCLSMINFKIKIINNK
jgi:hypothetical protein